MCLPTSLNFAHKLESEDSPKFPILSGSELRGFYLLIQNDICISYVSTHMYCGLLTSCAKYMFLSPIMMSIGLRGGGGGGGG